MNARIVAADGHGISEAAASLRAGELVGMPTETVYGLAADATRGSAVARIFAAKGRPPDHPLIVHIATADIAKTWASDWPDVAQKLAAAFWPGPMTLIVERAAHVLNAVTGGQDTVGLRVPSHPAAQALLREFQGALAAPSANKFGRVSPTTAQHVAAEFDDVGLLVLDGGACEVGVESTIIDVSAQTVRILRPGRIRTSEIERVVGQRIPDVDNQALAPRVSGSLDAHYAPAKKTLMLESEALNIFLAASRDAGKRVGLIHHSQRFASQHVTQRIALAGSDSARFEHEMYAVLRALDASDVDLIVIEAPPQSDDWAAVNDRLHRATFASR
jgi:L-threonylcarbamoyladenylate synthase